MSRAPNVADGTSATITGRAMRGCCAMSGAARCVERRRAMNEVAYGQPSQQAASDSNAALASQLGGSSVATQELAQLILLGMQRDIESQIDWRLQQQGGAQRKTV